MCLSKAGWEAFPEGRGAFPGGPAMRQNVPGGLNASWPPFKPQLTGRGFRRSQSEVWAMVPPPGRAADILEARVEPKVRPPRVKVEDKVGLNPSRRRKPWSLHAMAHGGYNHTPVLVRLGEAVAVCFPCFM